MKLLRLGLLTLLLCSSASWACSVFRITSPQELVSGADAVVRAVAVEYQAPPSNPNLWTSGVPDSVVRFDVLETIRGTTSGTLTLHGYLVQRDDFNERPVPYDFVRPGGRGGSCFANAYRQRAEYLLFLKQKKGTSELMVEWAALAPVNEQLHNSTDPWLLWVRQQAAKLQQ